MPKQTLKVKAKKIVQQLKEIDWTLIKESQTNKGEKRAKIIQAFLKEHKISFRGIFQIKEGRSPWSTSFTIKEDQGNVFELVAAKQELDGSINQMLKALFPSSYNKYCAKCESRIIEWSGFCPQYKLCECNPNQTVSDVQTLCALAV